MFFHSASMSSSYYDDFYSKFHNSQKIFTKNSNMQTKYFHEASEVKLPWVNALASNVPRANGEIYRGTMKDLQGDEEFFKR